MGKPFLANHCVLEGFENVNADELTVPAEIKKKMKEELPMFDSVEVFTVGKNETRTVVRIPSLKEIKVEELLKKKEGKLQQFFVHYLIRHFYLSCKK